MKTTIYLLIGLLVITISTSCQNQKSNDNDNLKPNQIEVPKMKMTTDIPEGIVTPDVLETQIGTLTSFDGVPDEKTTQLVYDNLDLQRATQAMLSTIQVASLNAMERGMLEFGPPNTTALLFEELMDSKALWLTPNTVSVYMGLWLELGDEPMVLETPPNVLGFIDDAWFNYVVDFGNAGPDKGQGGKFLILPPGYEGDVPEGYFVAKSNTYGNWVIWRGFQVDGSPKPAIDATKDKFKVYPLSQKDNPPAMKFVNMSGVPNNTIHSMDFSYWEELNETIQAEPINGLEPEVRGLLASIGIEKGKEFNPDTRMKGILTEAAKIGSVTARALTARPKDERLYVYPGERIWTNPFIEGRYDFMKDGGRLLDSRVYMHFYATGITPAMAIRNVGKGSQYLIAYLDENGQALDGSETYKINLPPNVPAKDFWSFTLYDNQTRSMLQTDQQLPGLDNNQEGLKQNADGSIDIYFSPQPPQGFGDNWIQTIPGKTWNTIFRLYGPLESFYDKTWKPSDPVLVK
ncbi:DUF1254 domain-containing protein [Eudoraea sp.]|uniref:DUF1254 domain-containing protein n=1 Tax=Eudoraea sp. TaxID=1979955 RepID=UPI003C71EB9B